LFLFILQWFSHPCQLFCSLASMNSLSVRCSKGYDCRHRNKERERQGSETSRKSTISTILIVGCHGGQQVEKLPHGLMGIHWGFHLLSTMTHCYQNGCLSKDCGQFLDAFYPYDCDISWSGWDSGTHLSEMAMQYLSFSLHLESTNACLPEESGRSNVRWTPISHWPTVFAPFLIFSNI